jgi:hypothetical protein
MTLQDRPILQTELLHRCQSLPIIVYVIKSPNAQFVGINDNML